MEKRSIIVGVDTSEPSKAALRWAARQAELTGSELQVVMTWDLPTTAFWAPMPEGLDLEHDARVALERAVTEVLGPAPAITVTLMVVRGHPAPILIDLSADADLLVVGNRGHGEFRGMLIGSVSEHCVTHAACPVVVVRGEEKGLT